MLQDHACFEISIAPVKTDAELLAEEIAAQRARGQMDRLDGHPAIYGCHVGMRSTRNACNHAYHAGWDEIDAALGGSPWWGAQPGDVITIVPAAPAAYPSSYPTFNAWWGENLDRFPTFGMAHDEHERLYGEGARMRMFQAHLKSLAKPAEPVATPAPAGWAEVEAGHEIVTPQALAAAMASAIVNRTRDDGSTYWTLTDGRPAWMLTIVQEAHAGMLPDDWRYGYIKAAVEFFEEDNAHGDCDPRAVFEIAEDAIESTVSTTNAALAAWLASGSRSHYVDEANQELGLDARTDIWTRLSEGQRAEITEVFSLVRSALVRAAEHQNDRNAGK
jgi:hypothetical protein